jgi:hypothetical protein
MATRTTRSLHHNKHVLGLQRETSVPCEVRGQLTLQRRHGGLGQTNHLEGRAAYLSADATAQRAMEAGPAPFRPFEGPMGAQLRKQWKA